LYKIFFYSLVCVIISIVNLTDIYTLYKREIILSSGHILYLAAVFEHLLLYLWSSVWCLAYYYYLSFYICPLYFLSFVDLRLLITPFVSSNIASFPHLIAIKMNVHVLLLVVLYNVRIIHSTVQSKGMAYSLILFRKSLKIQSFLKITIEDRVIYGNLGNTINTLYWPVENSITW
jgi:hypothetical protein